MKLHVKKGDMVKVLAGEKKGTVAKVLAVYPEKNRAIVEGVNVIKKHTKPNAKNTQGGIIEKEAPIHISNLMLVENKVATRIGRRIDEKTGNYETEHLNYKDLCGDSLKAELDYIWDADGMLKEKILLCLGVGLIITTVKHILNK